MNYMQNSSDLMLVIWFHLIDANYQQDMSRSFCFFYGHPTCRELKTNSRVFCSSTWYSIVHCLAMYEPLALAQFLLSAAIPAAAVSALV